jgi:hypothetical protein
MKSHISKFILVATSILTPVSVMALHSALVSTSIGLSGIGIYSLLQFDDSVFRNLFKKIFVRVVNTEYDQLTGSKDEIIKESDFETSEILPVPNTKPILNQSIIDELIQNLDKTHNYDLDLEIKIMSDGHSKSLEYHDMRKDEIHTTDTIIRSKSDPSIVTHTPDVTTMLKYHEL